jgi:hypothetical protein
VPFGMTRGAALPLLSAAMSTTVRAPAIGRRADHGVP